MRPLRSGLVGIHVGLALFALLARNGVLAQDEAFLIKEYVRAYYIPTYGDSSTKFSQSVTKLGDVNGDGIMDLAAGSPRDGLSNDGSVILMYLNRAGGWSGYALIEAMQLGLPTGRGAEIGWAVAALDDSNGDGVQDVAITSIGTNAGSPYPEGAVHLVQLTTDGAVVSSQTINGTDLGASEGDDFGYGLAAVGAWDTGLSAAAGTAQDLLVGAPGMGGDGCLFLLRARDGFSHESGVNSVCAAAVDAAGGSDGLLSVGTKGLGFSLAHLGGRRVAAGAPYADEGRGRLWLLTLGDDLSVGSGGAVQVDAAGTLGLEENCFFGSSVAVLSSSTLVGGGGPSGVDLDGSLDTLDLAVGAERFQGVEADSGAVFILVVRKPYAACSHALAAGKQRLTLDRCLAG